MRIAVQRAARYDKLRRQAYGFPWRDHRTIGQVDEQARLERLHRTGRITPSEYRRLRDLRHREDAITPQDRDALGRFA